LSPIIELEVVHWLDAILGISISFTDILVYYKCALFFFSRGYANYQGSYPVIGIGRKIITSIPDAVIYKVSKNSSSKEKILAVVEVRSL
jgi:hypothetical protein